MNWLGFARGERVSDVRFAVIDVETTGFDPRGDAVVEVACVVVRGGERIERFTSLVDPRRAIPPRTTAVHGIERRHVAGAPTLARLMPRLLELTHRAVVVAHNAAFDLGFLPALAPRRTLCTLRFARLTLREAPNHRVQTLRAHLGVPDAALEGSRAHSALGDALVASHILDACLARYAARGGRDDVGALLATVAGRRPLGDGGAS